VKSKSLKKLPDPSTLVLAQPLPLTMHPAQVYLASLGVGSRRTMGEALNAIARLGGVVEVSMGIKLTNQTRID
jgi:hypothetical protein